MDHVKSTIALQGTVPAPTGPKLKGGNGMASSPSHTNFNNCTNSPLSSMSNNGRRSTSPFSSSYTPDSGCDEIMSKNGNNSHVASPPMTTTPSSLPSTTGPTNKPGLKSKNITSSTNEKSSNTYLSSDSPNAVQGSTTTLARDKVITSNHVTGDVPRNSHARTYSGTRNNRSSGSNCTRRFNSEVSGSNEPGFVANKRNVLNTVKVADAANARTDSEYVPDISGGRPSSGYDSPYDSYHSPGSSESALTSTAGRSKSALSHNQEELVSSSAISSGLLSHTNNRISRTSSNNSVSDLSRCSEVTDDNNNADSISISMASSSESILPRVAYSPSRQGRANVEAVLPYSPFADEAALVSALGNLQETDQNGKHGNLLGLDESKVNNSLVQDDLSSDKLGLGLGDVPFGYPVGATGPDDIRSDALNLSAEDVRQTLNSVSVEPGISDLTADTDVFENNPTVVLSNNNVSYDVAPANASGSADVLPHSATAVSLATSTSSTTTIVTTAVNSTTNVTSTMPCSTASVNNCTTSSTSISFSPTSGPGTQGRSHLQEILGDKDTDRLKKMSCPIDVPYQSTTPTSYPSSIPTQSGLVMPNSSTSSVQNSQQFHRFSSMNTPPYQRHSVQPLTPTNTSHYVGSSHGPMMYDNPGLHAGFPDHSVCPRPGIPFDSNVPTQHHQGMPYSHPSPSRVVSVGQSLWPRPGCPGGMAPSQGPKGGDGSKSPRGPLPGPKFLPTAVNPMSGLQSTVNAIPEVFPNSLPVGPRTKNSGNNIGPTGGFHNVPGSVGGANEFGGGLSPAPGGSMLPPPSPSLQPDKRSVSADGSIVPPATTKKSSKRERGPSVDAKDCDRKDSGPKNKRRKSKSKDESKKADSKSRSNSVSDAQSNPYVYIFNSDVANAAAEYVQSGNFPSIIKYHQASHKNCRLEPSKQVKKEKFVGQSFLTSPMSGGQSGVRPVKTESSLLSPISLRPDDTKPTVKSEFESGNNTATVKTSSSPTFKAKAEPTDEPLSDEQRRHREESLIKLKKIGDMITGPPSRGNNYTMSKHLHKVMAKENPAYNEKKKSLNAIPGADNVVLADPPPYTPSHLAGPSPRWMNQPPGQDMINTRCPGPGRGGQMRLPFATDVRGTTAYVPPNRFPSTRGYGSPTGPGGRLPLYPNPGPQPGVMGNLGRQPMPRIPQTHMNHPESFPFSEKLKKKASIYQTDGAHAGPGGNMSFEMSNAGDPAMGIRMSSPEWHQFANPGSVPPHGGTRLSHITETMSPPQHVPMGVPGQNMMMPSGTPMPGQPMDPSMGPGAESRLTPNAVLEPSGLRMNNPAMCGPPFSYSGKPPNTLPTYQDSPMSSMHSYSPHDIKPPTNPMSGNMSMPPDRPSFMNESMEKRGDPRPPDLKLNLIQGRPPIPSPSIGPAPGLMGQPSFMHGEMAPLPQISPHPSAVPRSPMINSPGMLKPSMGNANPGPYPPMGQPGLQMAMDHPNMMPPGHSVADRGAPIEWSSMPQASMAPPRTPSSVGLMPSSHGPRPQSAIGEMINRMNSYPIHTNSSIYQEAVKASPPPLSHMNGGVMMSQDPPPLSHNPNNVEPSAMPMMTSSSGPMVRTPGGNMMPQHLPGGGAPPGYDPMSGPRSAGPRSVGPPMSDGYMSDYNRPPSHSGICMSPSMHPQQQNMMQHNPTAMDMHGGPSGYMPQHGPLMHGPGGMIPSGPMSGIPSSEPPLAIPKFDLNGMIPKEKPSQTLSYFPPADPSVQDSGHGDPGASLAARSPTAMQQQAMHPRFPSTSMGHRLFNPATVPFPTNSNPAMRGGAHINYGGPNPPGYPGHDPYPPSWDSMPGVPRPQMMPNSGPSMHPGSYAAGGRPLI